MLRKCTLLWLPAAARATKSVLSPLEVLTQIQLGITPPLVAQRSFLLECCEPQLERRGVTEAKLIAMDSRLCAELTKQLVYEQYLAVPFRVFSFDMEFTGPPVFTADGPTEDITEIGVYSPLLDKTFSCLVQPACGRKQGPGVEELTHITDEMLARDGIPFVDAWQRFLDFVHTPQPDELPGSDERILLLSHGGKLADVSLIKWTLEKFNLELPRSFMFGDTIHLIRDAHRRRPVTVDKHPPSWKLGDLIQWLHIPPTLPAHRAGNDARMTWDALYHTLLRYGDDEMTPREQLIPRFYDEVAKQRMRESAVQRQALDDPLMSDDTFLLADAAMTELSTSVSTAPSAGASGEDSQWAAAAQGYGARQAGAAQDLMDMDFDDIFKQQKAASASDAPPIEEFQLEEAGSDGAQTNGYAVPTDELTDTNGEEGSDSTSSRRPARGKQAKRSKKPKASNTKASTVSDDVFLV